MTVAELIAELKNHDPTIRVVISGYEGGVSDVTFVESLTVALDVNKETWYYGDHEDLANEVNARRYSDYDKAPALKIS
jgi:hypothetical protein